MKIFLPTIGLFFHLICCQSQPAQTFAVVVGISDYKILNANSGDLRYAKSDAVKFVNFLKTRKGGSISASNMHFLSNSNATKANILEALNIFANANDNDKVIFYFSGHGNQLGFIPYDVSNENINSIISYKEIKNAFKNSDASIKICYADACMSGTMKENKNETIHYETKNTNVAMILSSRASQNSVESFRASGGVFTYFLLKGLNGDADVDHNNIVTIKELFKFMKPSIRKNTPNKQSPVFYGKFSDDLPMSFL
jgi:uncharacterized caspase-like protein